MGNPDDYAHSVHWTDFYEYDEDWDLDHRSDVYSYERDFDYDDTYAEDISDRYVVVERKKKRKKGYRYAYVQDWDHRFAFAKKLSDCYAAKSEVSHVANDGSLGEDPDHDEAIEDDQGDDDDDASPLVSSDVNGDVSSLNKLKSMEDASQTIENGDTECTNVASVTESPNGLLKEIQPVKETMDVNGFQVFSSQVEKVNYIFKRHPDIALGFRPKNQQIRRAYMNELLNLIETLCQSPEKLSIDDLSNIDETLVDLIDVCFKLDWLKIKLKEVSEKKKTVQNSEARVQTMEEELQKLKQMFLVLECQLQKEKEEALAARVPLSFIDVVC